MKGYLVVYVFGYFVEDSRCADHNSPPQLRGTRGWSTDEGGWAFGDNQRGRYCAIKSPKIRKFRTFDSAIEAIYQQQQKKRRNERYQLVYRVGDVDHMISGEDEIPALDEAVEAKEQEAARAKAEQLESFNRRLPELELLRSRHPASLALSLSRFLGELRANGMDAAIAETGVARSSAFRYRKLLIAAGVKID